MPSATRLPRLTLILSLLLFAAACSTEQGAPVDAPDEGAPVDAPSESDDGDGAAEQLGTAAPSEDDAESEPPRQRNQVELGKRRTVPLSEAIDKVPYDLLAPSELPNDSDLTVVHLVEAVEGIPNEALPAVRMIFDLNGGTSTIIVLHHLPYADMPSAPGEPVDVGGLQGYVESSEAGDILTIDRDGLRMELRSRRMDRQSLLNIASNMGPAANWIEGAVAP